MVGELGEGEESEDSEVDEQGEGGDVEQQVGEPGQAPQAVVGPPVEAGGKMGAMSVIRGTSTCSRSLAKKHKSVLP